VKLSSVESGAARTGWLQLDGIPATWAESRSIQIPRTYWSWRVFKNGDLEGSAAKIQYRGRN
jgi:hypothetical protein